MAKDIFARAADRQAERGKVEARRRSSSTTPVSFRLDRDLVNAFKATCAANGESMTHVLERLMREYIG